VTGESVSWREWWYYHRARYLELQATLDAHRTVTPSRRLDVTWRDRAITALIAALDDPNIDTSTGAAVALGKASAVQAVPALRRLLASQRADRTLREASALALGLVSRPEGRAALEKVLFDAGEARRLRAFAAIGLGLTRSVSVVPNLLRVASAKRVDSEIRAAAYVALGIVGDDIVTPFLADAARGRGARLGLLERAAATDALGRIGDRDAIPVLVELIGDSKREVRRGAILSLGRLVRADDAAAVRALATAATSEVELLARAYAAIALGRTGARAGAATLHGLLDDPRIDLRGFAAIGLGILGRECDDEALREKVATFLRRAIESRRLSGDRRASIAVALGILKDRESVGAIGRIVVSKDTAELRGHAAVALGMIGDRAALPVIRQALDGERDPALLRDLALAAGLLGDSEAIRMLVDLLKSNKSQYQRGNIALALGRVGGPTAANAMVTLLESERSFRRTRAMAAVALGHLLDDRPMPALFTIVEDFDYRLRCEAFVELIRIL
jgi:HEAT repeat protein